MSGKTTVNIDFSHEVMKRIVELGVSVSSTEDYIPGFSDFQPLFLLAGFNDSNFSRDMAF